MVAKPCLYNSSWIVSSLILAGRDEIVGLPTGIEDLSGFGYMSDVSILLVVRQKTLYPSLLFSL